MLKSASATIGPWSPTQIGKVRMSQLIRTARLRARRGLVFAGALLAAGCALPPVNMGATSLADGALVFGMVRTFADEGVNLHDLINLLKVDGRHVAYYGSTPDSQAIGVSAGSRLLSVEFKFTRLRQRLPHHALIDVSATLVRGKQYKLDGRVDDAWVEAWVADAESGARISDVHRKMHGPGRPDPISMPLMVPLPKR